MNIWEVLCVSDLVKILKDSSKQFVILGIVLDTTPKPTQIIIKKFLKEKAKYFPNMKFLFFKATSKDLGKISLLDKDEAQYPFVYHIYDTSSIFIKVNSATQQTLIDAFNAGEQYYRQNLEEYLSIKEQAKVISEKPDNQKNMETKEDNKKINIQNKEKEINMEEWTKQQSELESQQKIIEKIVTFQERAKDFNLELLKDIQQRKAEEDKIRRK
jgi:hypothetical protein